ncbi:MAG TPA: ABC transporter permease [Longimicrobiales bacterium]|nr:ABC transporter permease [Longimicrobiales bacterium]
MRDWNEWVRQRLSLPEMEGHREERIIAELADHLDGVYRDALTRGASPEEAEARAEGQLGGADAAGELIRTERAHLRAQAHRRAEQAEERARARGGAWARLADGARDLRLAARALAGKPFFSGAVILILALGIGASTAVFTLLDEVVLSPLPFDGADRLVRVAHEQLGSGNVGQCSAWHYTYEEENRVFQDLGMWFMGTAAVTGQGEPEAVPLMSATAGVLRTLRLSPVVGRALTPEDEDPESPRVAVLGHGYWQRRFGADPNVVGRTLEVNGYSMEIVGVLPAALRGLGVDPGVVTALRVDKAALFVGNIGGGGVARLRDGVTLEEASADVARMLPMAFEKFPGGPVIESMSRARFEPALEPLKDAIVGSAANLLWILMAGVAAVLLIACANVANLFLVRAEGKATEMAVRTAMGAGTARIGWEHLKESLLLGVAGGAAGLGLAWLALRTVVPAASALLPRLPDVSLDPGVVLFAVALSVGSGLLVGAVAVLRHVRSAPADALKVGRSSSARRRGATRSVLVVTQVALALVVLTASGLMLRTAWALSSVDPGFRDPEGVLALRLSIPPSDAPEADDIAAAYEAIVRRLEQVSGVSGVALANSIPLDGFWNVNPLYAEGVADPSEPSAMRQHKWIGEGYFETLRIPLVAGRGLTWDDVHQRRPVAVVSERVAREMWGSAQAAIGKGVAARPDPPRWHEVVGVAADVHEQGAGQDTPPVVYWPLVTLAFFEGSAADEPMTWRAMGIALRSHRVGTADFITDVRDAVWSVNPNLPVRQMRALDELEAQAVATTSFSLKLLAIAAAVALVLGMIGVYGVLSYAVSQRIPELGMRIALGAPVGRVMGMVIREGMALSLAGVAVGLALSAGLARLMSGLLFGVSPADPLTFGSVTLVLLAVALLASWLPARRAARIDPTTALRAE